MLENIKEATAQLDQYRMAMQIIELWQTWRTPAIFLGFTFLILSIYLFIRAKRGRIFFLMLAIILGLTTLGLDRFKKHVEKQRKEAIREQLATLPEKIIEFSEESVDKVTDTIKKMLPFGKKK